VVGTSSSGDLLHFWLKEGGSWKSENVSQIAGRKIKGEASFNWDADAGLGTAVIAAGPNNEFLVFHHAGPGSWSVEDVTAATATGTSSGITLGGWLSWCIGEISARIRIHPNSRTGRRARRERPFLAAGANSSASPWTTVDVSAIIGQTFRADTGGDSILIFDNRRPSP